MIAPNTRNQPPTVSRSGAERRTRQRPSTAPVREAGAS